jgi:hypothetical protein
MMYKKVIVLLCVCNILHSMDSDLVSSTGQKKGQQSAMAPSSFFSRTTQAVSPYVRQIFYAALLPLGASSFGGNGSVSNASFVNATQAVPGMLTSLIVPQGESIFGSENEAIIGVSVLGGICICSCICTGIWYYCCKERAKKNYEETYISSAPSGEPFPNYKSTIQTASTSYISNVEYKKQKYNNNNDAAWLAVVAVAASEYPHDDVAPWASIPIEPAYHHSTTHDTSNPYISDNFHHQSYQNKE